MNIKIAFYSLLILLSQACGKGLPAKSNKNGGASSYSYCSGTCRIFMTAASYNGNLGGVSGADQKCQSDVNKPAGNGLYKALISGTTRHACTSAHCLSSGASENLNWVLKPNTKYVRVDGTTEIFTTNTAGVITLLSSGNSLVNAITIIAANAWSGTSSDIGTEWLKSTNTCNDWTSNIAADAGEFGRPDLDTYEAFGSYVDTCDNQMRLVCVEQ